MKKEKPDDKRDVDPIRAKQLAQAMFLLADKKLPPGKRRLTKSLTKKQKDQ